MLLNPPGDQLTNEKACSPQDDQLTNEKKERSPQDQKSQLPGGDRVARVVTRFQTMEDTSD